MNVSYEEKDDRRISEILKQLEAVADRGSREKSKEWQGSKAGVRQGGDADTGARSFTTGGSGNPRPWGRELPAPGKSGTRLFSWRSDRQVQDAIAKVARYLQLQRDLYYPTADPLNNEWKKTFSGFYSTSLLDRVRISELKDRRVANPSFYEKAKADGITGLPDMAHRAVVTFLDVIVFHEKIASRHLFHGLVHTAQVKLLGPERYAELFVTGFLNSRSFFLVPVKAHAFLLDTRYAEDPEARFSVEQEVLRWAAEDRY